MVSRFAACASGLWEKRLPLLESRHASTYNTLLESFKCIFLASDGVWDFVGKKKISRLVFEENREQAILKEVLKRVG